MRLSIAGVVDAAALARLRTLLARGRFEDGRRTAGDAARRVKHNLQLDPAGAEYGEAAEIVRQAFAASDVLQAAAWPAIVSPPLFSRYEAGMGYGAHVDNALMAGPALRADLAWTLFLSAPGDYDGGALVLEEADGESSIRLDAGALFLYPATTIHRVEPVTRGVRQVCVGWVQSRLRDPRVREIAFDLARVKALLADAGSDEARLLAGKALSNLLRMHLET